MVISRSTHAAALALEYGDRLVVRTARDVHRAVAGRAFGPTRPFGGRGPEAVHDAISNGVYAGLAIAARSAGTAVRTAADRGIGRPTDHGAAERVVASAVNGLIGAELRSRADPYAISMAVRQEARDLAVDPGSLARAFADASSHLVIFVHGLGENEDYWRLNARTTGGTYAGRVAAETGATPLLIRYNTGLHVSDNGAELASLVAGLVEHWPVDVRDITLVGHSMGGLVLRAATNQAVAAGAGWPGLVRHVICLGTPHLGASLEKLVHVGGRALALFPESAPFGRILQTRSPGIVDLRHGYISRHEWEGQDLTRRWGLDRVAAANLPNADYHFVAATVGATGSSPVSQLLGDLFVRMPSAIGQGRRGEPVVAHASIDHLSNTGHFALLNHPRIADWLVGWINDEPRTDDVRGAAT